MARKEAVVTRRSGCRGGSRKPGEADQVGGQKGIQHAFVFSAAKRGVLIVLSVCTIVCRSIGRHSCRLEYYLMWTYSIDTSGSLIVNAGVCCGGIVEVYTT